MWKEPLAIEAVQELEEDPSTPSQLGTAGFLLICSKARKDLARSIRHRQKKRKEEKEEDESSHEHHDQAPAMAEEQGTMKLYHPNAVSLRGLKMAENDGKDPKARFQAPARVARNVLVEGQAMAGLWTGSEVCTY